MLASRSVSGRRIQESAQLLVGLCRAVNDGEVQKKQGHITEAGNDAVVFFDGR
jgi:hypothetical protein